MPTLDRIAKTIVGPNETHNFGLQKLTELQDLKWGRLKAQEQAHFLRSAKYLQGLFESDPDGWVVLNGDDTMVRAQEYNELSSTFVTWVSDLDKAIWFARRDDAECFARDDEGAWHIRRVSEVRAMWAARPQQGLAEGAAQSAGQAPRVITKAPPVPPPVPAPPLCDQRSTEHLLRLFRAFVTRNATQWCMGAGDHHHPIWQDVTEELDQHDLNEDPTFGPDWAYIQPMNRKPYTELLAEYVDQFNAHEGEERGG